MPQLDSEPQNATGNLDNLESTGFSELMNPQSTAADQVPEIAITELIPASIRERVTIAPPEPWVTVHEFDREYRPDFGSGATTILMDAQNHVGRKAFYFRSTRRLDTSRAVQQLAQWKFESFDPGTDRFTLHHLTVIRGGNSIEQAQIRRLRFLQREANLENLILTGILTIAVILDDVRVGDILDFAYTLERSSRIPTDKFGTWSCVPVNEPIGAFRYSVTFSNGAPMQWKGSVEFGAPAIQSLDGETNWSWSLEKVRPKEIERSVPARHFVFSWIQVSSYESWGEVASAFHTAWMEQFDDANVVERARAIAAASASPAVRADKAITFVQDELRYLSVNTDLGGAVPAPPGEILTRRFGDCKDKAFLLVHLLRWLGIPARPALVNANSGRGIEQFLPMPAAFNHAVVEYSIKGQRRWVDATISKQGGGALERFIPDYGLALPISLNVTELETIPASPSKDYYHLRESFRLDTTGRPPLLRVAISMSGSNADNFRRAISLDGSEAVSRAREEFYRTLFPQVRRLDALEWRDDRLKNELLTAEAYELPGALHAVTAQNAYIFRCYSYVVRSLLSYPESAKRKQPLALHPRIRIEHFIELESPGLPRGNSENFIKRSGSFRISFDTKKLFGRWTTHFTLRIIEPEVPHQLFDQFREHVKEILPKIFVTAVLPAGVVAPRGKRRGLGPIVQDPETADGERSSADMFQSLPAEPALALGPMSDEPPQPSTSMVHIGPRRSDGSADDPSDHSFVSEEQPSDFSIDATGAADAPSQTRRRRKRRKTQSRKLLLWLIPAAAVLAVFIWYLLHRLRH